MTPIPFLTLAAALLAVVLLVIVLLRQQAGSSGAGMARQLDEMRLEQARGMERLEREVRTEVAEAARGSRGESAQQMLRFQQALSSQLTGIATLQNNQIDTFAQQLAKLTETNTQQLEQVRQHLMLQSQQARDEQAGTLRRFGDGLQQQLAQLSEANERRLAEVRATLEKKLQDIEANNAAKLEEMRRTVDEKLHATLEQRLGESFRLVSDRLEQVHRGLGEMQVLAQGVGDLKKVLTNVKSRGTWGEVQLEMLLEQMLTPEQYGKNVETVRNSGARVEFAIRLPGKAAGADPAPVWLPVDAKFPKEQYERLVDAQERGDPDGVLAFGRELETALRREAQTIAEKYLAPPQTTDFAILFLPTEGLYAEVLRRPGLTDQLQRDYRVTVAGPTTLTALLNSLQMGFRTLALEKRSSEVWEVLGAVKTEFGKFGDVLAKTRDTLERAARNIEQAEVRTRQMARKLRTVEALPGEAAQQLLGLGLEAAADGTPENTNNAENSQA
ncbi:putative DNA recombination protein, rmuC family; putative exported protein [Cupriavidus taiwanensis]|uniref:DNA recombination protein RmuC n=1 Tax=Cupriavidus taiwanensis TaxID=164546 RepID=UPI000E1239C0|nr:DNA recombination protein RmuC [Cupriavidus taiwanensis]SOZ13593.1 putative DNA recombination protein, rmuC family; putative exported protein [Cupriavidus taiwanensis]SOZ23827.1 putative DNA recombination protein, rmuC family; putative exported protein [Cupriavidus taiwanensis]SOZ44201.1 putative DNA recombination protein, rmuC family; putative exported protein [Cupriavidus taiwanensis]